MMLCTVLCHMMLCTVLCHMMLRAVSHDAVYCTVSHDAVYCFPSGLALDIRKEKAAMKAVKGVTQRDHQPLPTKY